MSVDQFWSIGLRQRPANTTHLHESRSKLRCHAIQDTVTTAKVRGFFLRISRWEKSPHTNPTPKPHGHAVNGTTTVGRDLSRPSTGHRRPKDDRGRHSCRPGTPRMRWIHPSSLTPFSDHCIAHRAHIPCPPNCRLAWPGDSWCSPQSRHVPAC